MSQATDDQTSGVGAPPPQDARKRDLLPSGAELLRQRNLPPERRPTLAEIGERYGVSRQAVHKRITKYLEKKAS